MPSAFNVDWVFVSTRDVANNSLNLMHYYQACNGKLPWEGHHESALVYAMAKAGGKLAKVPMALALASEPADCVSDSCRVGPSFKGHSGQLGCCVGGLRLQCYYQNYACDAALRHANSSELLSEKVFLPSVG